MKTTDTLHVVISDMHTGSNYALFVDREWHGRNTSHAPRPRQKELRKHWLKFAADVKAARKGKRVRVIHNGDCIDGDHHHSGDVCTTNELEQAELHIELMEEFRKLIDWQRGDEIYYVKGTETHTKDNEDFCGRELGAIPCGDFGAWDVLELNTNGTLSLFYHHGSKVASGANEGSAQISMMRNLQIDAMKNASRPPDILYSGHVHQPTYKTHTYKTPGAKTEYRTMHYVITPSWQEKTRFAYRVAPVSVNKIGGVIHEIKADGAITVPRFVLMGE